MCGRYRLTEKMSQKFEAEFRGELRPRCNIAPTQLVPVVRAIGSGRVIFGDWLGQQQKKRHSALGAALRNFYTLSS